jgi:hypothetical protein
MSRSICWISALLLFVSITSAAQNYSASLIPDSLTENAHAVIREYTKEFELQSVNKGTERIKKVITILDENGADYGNLRIHYDKDSKIDIRLVTLYDKTGKIIKKISSSDFSDVPAYDGASLYSDNRMKTYSPRFGEYPYTIKYEYETTLSNLISYGSWYPFYGYNLSLERSEFSFIHPAGIQFRKRESNICSPSEISYQGGIATEKWKCNSIKAIEDEPYDIDLSERLPKVALMPVNIIYNEYSGTADSWQNYGKWVRDLYARRDEIPANVKTKLDALIGNSSDTIKIIKLLYAYLQENTRYVGVQLGIGGLQPFDAATVAETGYGDCKALTNFMYSMLKQFGIVSYPALVASGTYIEQIYKDFPNFQQFNHVILCVPLQRDTLWLECTSQTIPFGFLGDFTDNRDVLLITDEGGKLAHTKRYGPQDNTMSDHGEFDISKAGEATCTIKTKYAGLQYNDVIEVFNESSDEQKKWIYQTSSLPSQQVTGFSITNVKDRMPEGFVERSLTSKNYCSFTGNYMIMPVNIVNVSTPVKKNLKERKSDFIIHRSTVDYDTLIYRIPSEIKIESAPAGKTIKSEFGNYRYAITINDHTVIYTRMFELKEGRFKASQYKSLFDFFAAVSKADNEKIMLSK